MEVIIMKRYIRSARDQYLPDMTERFPEGRDGIDLTDSYFPEKGYYGGEDPRGYEPSYAEWEADYYADLVKRINAYNEMSDEEFEALSEAEKQEYYDMQEELREYNDSDGANWSQPTFSTKFNPEIMKTTGTIVKDNKVEGTYGEFTYGGYWAQIGDDYKYNEAHFDTCDEMIEYLSNRGYSIESEDYMPFE